MLRKCESGAQLLARLQTRPNLSSLDPLVFTAQDVTPSTSSSSHHQGKIIELYGAEGVGKTELVLNYIARACICSQWNGLSLPGLGAKVILIDTELKFTVLRFAVILERLILNAVNEYLKETSSSTGSILLAHSSHEKSRPTPGKSQTVHVNSEQCATNSYSDTNSRQGEPDIRTGSTSTTSDKCSRSVNEQITGNIPTMGTMKCTKRVTSILPAPNEVQEESGNQLQRLTPEDVDEIVQDSLRRLQVLRVSSSLQLLTSLMSLDHTLSCDPNIALIVIDSVSSFYWSDRALEPDNVSCIEAKMKPLAQTISKYADGFGVTFLMTKFALIANKKKWGSESHKNWRLATKDGGDRDFEHVEFLGRSWSAMHAKTIVLHKQLLQGDMCEFRAFCNDWPSERRFSLMNEIVHFL